MDKVIFEDPSKQRPRLKRPLQVQPIVVTPNQNDPTHGEQQRCVPSQRLGASDLDLGGSGRSYENSTKYVDGDKGGQVHDTPDRSDFNPAGVTSSSVLELFSMLEDNRSSIDEGSLGQRDSLFSSPEPEGSAMDSDTSASSAADKRGGAATPAHFDSYNQTGQGKDQDVAILLEDDGFDGDAVNWVVLRNEILVSEVGEHDLRIRRPPTDREESDGMEPCAESDNSERGDDVHHATTARNDGQRSGIQVEGRTGIVSLSNHSHRTDAARVIGPIQQSTLNRRNTQQTASPTFPLSRKRRGVTLPESPSRGLDVSDDEASCRKKVSLSRSSQNRRATQKGALTAMRSRPEFPLPGRVSRSGPCEIPSSPDEEQRDVKEGVVWEYTRLLGYRIVNGKPLVLVPWIPTWEPPDEYPEDEVDRVRREYQAQMPGRRRGMPRSKQHF